MLTSQCAGLRLNKPALVKIKASGINFTSLRARADTQRVPFIADKKAGVCHGVGAEVTDLKPGDRVAYCGITAATRIRGCPDSLVGSGSIGFRHGRGGAAARHDPHYLCRSTLR